MNTSPAQGRAARKSSTLDSPISTAWWLDAVFYELSVKSFFDANGDGIGDFAGLTRKLDYVVQLGATCVWLLPFYPSPLEDDGYDVSDYRAVHPAYGTIQDFRTFLSAAHERGLRVVAEVVINHTSDRHPWFQAAREAPAGSPLRDFYVWSDETGRYAEAPLLFPSANRSNWTWDETAKAWYWHRFFAHQPELNYANPQVREEMLRVLRFWADLGADGLCLAGASYLAEREGTRCEHLPETHAALKEFRRELASAYPYLLLEAGVNARPEEAAGYFGGGDECHAVPNLALTGRLFQSIRQEDRHPVADVMRHTPDPPTGCRWINVLRNHDELTFGVTTDDERDELLRAYADVPAARRHAGILRRLAPLVENDRRRIELLFGLLFSLPGAPVIYYGDEVGMGDNVRLPGRSGVRTPMQWTADRNAGFSEADASRLDVYPVADPVYGYQAVNVAAQQRDPSSLFHWVRRLIASRKHSAAVSHGDLELLEPDNRKVLAFVRRNREETILVVANLSRTAQPVELDLAEFAGRVPVEMSGRTPFPKVGLTPYLITLGGYDFFWFALHEEIESPASRLAPVETEAVEVIPTVTVSGDWTGVLDGASCEDLERNVLPAYLRSQRWFGGKARTVRSVQIADRGLFPAGQVAAFLVLLDVEFVQGGRDRYFLPLAVTAGPDASRLLQPSMRSWVVARLRGPAGDAVLHDALADDRVCTALMAMIGEARAFRLNTGSVRAEATSAFAALRSDAGQILRVVRGPATSSNSLVFFGRRLLLKLFRRLEVGTNPDYEIGRFLTEQGRFDRVPSVAGTIEYRTPDAAGPVTLGILQALVPNQGDGWAHAIDELARYYDRASGRMFGHDLVSPDPRPLPRLAEAVPPPAAVEAIDGYLSAAATLGRRTAEMHLALASNRSTPDFAPEPLAPHDAGALRDEILAQGRRALGLLGENLDRLPAEIRPQAERLLAVGPAALDRLSNANDPVPSAVKTRIHGDYHLGQVLRVENDYVILDFEGEPTRSVEERREKFSPVRDVAGMLRSYHYAAYAGLFAFTQNRPDDFPRLVPWADLWQQWVSAAFLRAYLAAAAGAPFLPRDAAGFVGLLDRFALAKAFYELNYELNNRPDWVRIPLGGVLTLLSGGRPGGGPA